MLTFLRWLWDTTLGAIRGWARGHPITALLAVMGCATSLFVFRAVLIHPVAIYLRIHALLFLIGLFLAAYLLYRFSQFNWKKNIVVVSLFLLVGAGVYVSGEEVYNYLLLYQRYQTLNIRELPDVPLTDNERISTLNATKISATEAMTETEQVTDPDYVQIGNDDNWTMAIEQAYPWQRLLGGVIEEIFIIPAANPAPTFAKEKRRQVHFEVGEHMYLSYNVESAVIKTLGISRFFSYEPADVKFALDDNGQVIQIVSLIRWRGIIFPMPEFGGVQIIRQKHIGFLNLNWLKLVLWGDGVWIPPEEIKRYSYLRGQNVMPREVSRFIANSFRFQEGFLSPLPGYHKGDVRIPNLPDDFNTQPFTVYFCGTEGFECMLYHYFALEPYGLDKQGLNTSILIPSDGRDTVYAIKHYLGKEGLVGVSSVPARVMESRKNYDWGRNHPVENRPYVKEINGRKRMFWLTTVVTLKDRKDARQFISGSIPDVVLTDAVYKIPVWVNAANPNDWTKEVSQALSDTWRKNE